MPLSSGFSQDLNPEYYVRRPGKTEFLDEAIYYRRNEPFERPVEVANRPIIRETIFMPERKPPPIIVPTREMYMVSPEPPPQPPPILYTTPAQHQPVPESSFNLIRALGLHADCPCWAWLCIILGFIILLGLIGMCLYFLLKREGYLY